MPLFHWLMHSSILIQDISYKLRNNLRLHGNSEKWELMMLGISTWLRIMILLPLLAMIHNSTIIRILLICKLFWKRRRLNYNLSLRISLTRFGLVSQRNPKIQFLSMRRSGMDIHLLINTRKFMRDSRLWLPQRLIFYLPSFLMRLPGYLISEEMISNAIHSSSLTCWSISLMLKMLPPEREFFSLTQSSWTPNFKSIWKS